MSAHGKVGDENGAADPPAPVSDPGAGLGILGEKANRWRSRAATGLLLLSIVAFIQVTAAAVVLILSFISLHLEDGMQAAAIGNILVGIAVGVATFRLSKEIRKEVQVARSDPAEL